MIGNKIEFLHYDFGNFHEHEHNRKREDRLRIGLVVDAYTEVKGKMIGSSEMFLGFGGGTTSGHTDSKRKYKVQYMEKYSNTPKFYDMYDWQLVKIISFAGQTNQELNEEKFQIG